HVPPPSTLFPYTTLFRSQGAFENAMTLDIAMGGSTNTVLHILAAAHEGGIDFDMDDIDALSRKVPVLCKVAPAKADVHMEDVHRDRKSTRLNSSHVKISY